MAKLFIPVFMNIAMAKFSMSGANAIENGHMSALTDRIVLNRDLQLGEAKKEVLAMIDAGYAPPMKKPLPVIGQAGQGMITAELSNMLWGGFLSEYDAMLAKRIGYVISGGEVREGTEVAEETILALEREAFVDFSKEEKTIARIEAMLTTGKPLRN
jgi:3-hydroxyacyl-CoA dehydrogenase